MVLNGSSAWIGRIVPGQRYADMYRCSTAMSGFYDRFIDERLLHNTTWSSPFLISGRFTDNFTSFLKTSGCGMYLSRPLSDPSPPDGQQEPQSRYLLIIASRYGRMEIQQCRSVQHITTGPLPGGKGRWQRTCTALISYRIAGEFFNPR